MKTSARNALRGTITTVESDTLTAEVTVQVSPDTSIVALVTRESLNELGLCPGREAVVLVKAPFVVIAPGEEAPRVSVRNCLRGTIARVETGAIQAEIVLDIGGGKTLAASITARSVASLGLEIGRPAFALVDAAHVILAID